MNSRKPLLTMPRSEIERRIDERIDKGKEILQMQISNEEELENARREYAKWTDYNADLMKRISDEFHNDYIRVGVRRGHVKPAPFEYSLSVFREDLENKINKLVSIKERLELYSDQSLNVREDDGFGNRIFIVHGRDDQAKETVARFIEKLDLKAVILGEKVSGGKTIIEKFEEYSDVGFAIVLLTPDDVGALSEEKPDFKPRARQNVIFELGFFIGKLGRERVRALKSGNLELPSDIQGWLWISLEDNWQLDLAREMKAAGLDVDLNKLS